jgi:hypothetical protein
LRDRQQRTPVARRPVIERLRNLNPISLLKGNERVVVIRRPSRRPASKFNKLILVTSTQPLNPVSFRFAAHYDDNGAINERAGQLANCRYPLWRPCRKPLGHLSIRSLYPASLSFVASRGRRFLRTDSAILLLTWAIVLTAPVAGAESNKPGEGPNITVA